MTQKELLYLENAIKHEQNLVEICEETINSLTDEEIISFMKNQQKEHKTLEKKLLKIMEDEING